MKRLTVLLAPIPLTLAAVAAAPATEHVRQTLLTEFVTEGAALGDVNGDANTDFVVGPFWFEGPAFENRHRYRPGEPVDINGYAHDSFLSFVIDVDGDRRSDILQVSHQPPFHLDLYLQPATASEDWPRHRVVDGFGGESPAMADLTGDGRPELIGIRDARWDFFTADPAKPTAPWSFHAVSGERALHHYSHGLGIGDINGDGRPDLVAKDAWFEAPADPLTGPWPCHDHKFSEEGGAQMLVFDVDGDGDNDVVTGLSAHGYGLAWFENRTTDGAISLTRHEIMPATPPPGGGPDVYSQLHAFGTGDFNGDGLTDFVTGKRFWAHNGNDPGAREPAVLYWYELQRAPDGARFIPHRIDSDSGVGCQLAVADLNDDGCDDVAIGNKKGAFVFRSRRGQ